jgi:hypothetical protein
MSGSERGGALPAAMALQLILLLVGLEVALATTVLRLAVARTGAQVQAMRLVEAAVAVAADEATAVLMAALEGDGNLAVDLNPMSPALAVGPVKVMDDDDGDGDLHQDDNGRILLVAQAGVVPFPGTHPSQATLVRETLMGSLLPLPAALVDCGDGLDICGGEDGCPVPPVRVEAAVGAALAVPEDRMADMGRTLFILSREVLRAARQRCESGVCQDQDDRLLRAAATQVMRRLDGETAHASDLVPEAVGLLVDGLLALEGDESGAGWFPWWDGTFRGVADMTVLPEAVTALALDSGHVPSLAEHPYPQVFHGPAEMAGAVGVCGRMTVYLEDALRRAADLAGAGIEPPPEEAVTVLDQPRRVGMDESFVGQGLLVVRETLTVAAGGRMEWRGSVVMDGGRLDGGGTMVIQGSLLILPRSGPGALDLATSMLHLVLDEGAHSEAWQSAGNILLSAWFGPAGS